MVDVSRLDPRVAAMVAGLRERFPQVRITSGFRDARANAAAGGAKGSQHLHGNAFDFSVRDLPEDQQRAIFQYLKESGATGFGYYPNSQSMHADVGSPRYWGPDKTSVSLKQTPLWFQEAAGIKSPVQVAEAPPAQPASTAPVYSADLGTAARYVANKVAPSMVDAPVPLTTEQIATQNADIAQYGDMSKGLGGISTGLLSLARLAQEPQQRPMQIEAPPVRRVQFVPLERLRGLLG